LLIGLGSNSSTTAIAAQGLTPDIYEAYLVGVGSDSWPTWNSPTGYYVVVHANRAANIGATPMFTLYQMASNGDGNLSGINEDAFMTAYWQNVRLMYQQIAGSDKKAFVVIEPDFWGYVRQQAPAGDPRQLPAKVAAVNADCADQPNNAVGIAGCFIKMRTIYAPNHAKIGFVPSDWGDSPVDVANYMVSLGTHLADFIPMESLDRDAGCYEALPRPPECVRGATTDNWYWDDAAYSSHLARARTYSQIMGLPLIWWQTPMGVPSNTPGGSTNRYRDNTMQYFLTGTGPADLVSAGGFGVVFSQGLPSQTGIETDGGQYQRLSTQYLAAPASLP
jgi:hypothetical protein